MTQEHYYLGIMSGTSLDGIDIALLRVDGHTYELYCSDCYPIPPVLRQAILDVCLGQMTTLQHLGELDHQLGQLYAESVQRFLREHELSPASIRAIGLHGQTVYHAPNGPYPFTIQLGNPHLVAVQTGIETVADFRRKDMALGGQGAPLVPAFHQQVFQPKDSTLVVLNIGGIANVSVLQPDGSVIGYDTGPGNVLMDTWCFEHTQQPYDKDAALALQGTVNHALLKVMRQDPYFATDIPKSTGREYFNADWITRYQQHITPDISVVDMERTLCELTAVTIAQHIAPHAVGSTPRLFICGGGSHHPLLISRLQQLLPLWDVTTTTEQGIPSDSMEAMAFAWLAHRRCEGLPSNLPTVTGASQSTSLGVIYQTTEKANHSTDHRARYDFLK